MMRNPNNYYMHLRKDKGFTIIEIIVVMVIIGVMTGAVGISVKDVNSKVRLTNAAARALSDIKRLKELAMNEGRDVSIAVNPSTDSYTLTVDGASETVVFNDGDYAGVDITSTDFSGPLKFDITGTPQDNGSDFDSERIIMYLNGNAFEIQVWGRTGLVTIDMADIQNSCGCGGGC